MIIRFPSSRRQTVDAAELPAVTCQCGYRATAVAAFCRRCGRALKGGAPAVSVQTTATPEPNEPILLGWERLRRPVGATARFVRLNARLSKPRVDSPHHPVARLDPDLSASLTITWPQVVVLRFVMAAFALAVVVNVSAALIVVISLATLLYLGALIFRIRTFVLALSAPKVVSVSDEEARSLWDRSLPNYTVLVPAYREPEVIGDLIAQLNRLEYPRDRLDIKLLLEDDDTETIAAAEAVIVGQHIEILRIPYSEPRTKPKALNLGLSRARGRRGRGMVTIFDAEDRPDPLQLLRAVVAFRRADPSVACVQAKLAYFNSDQNVITRWFSVEYAMWFSQLLPGLLRQAAPIPLGGTSNHFRKSVLERVGGWDPHNVTEDADLGIRLHRAGYRTQILDSVTLEEANSDFVNWVKQRSRWYKGYMQTWLVHMRHPVQLWRELGPAGFLGFNLFVGGTPLLALLNPLFWAMTAIWFMARPTFIAGLFPFWLYYLSLGCLLIGNFTFLYTAMVSARASGSPKLVLNAALSPAYWVMMSIAAIKALIQLIRAPSFWEKTFHGLDRPIEAEVSRRAAA